MASYSGMDAISADEGLRGRHVQRPVDTDPHAVIIPPYPGNRCPYNKYGHHSIPLSAGRENYLIVVDDALDAAATLEPETGD